jgi:hypothetical protein
LIVPDMDTSDTAGGAGGDGIADGATVTIVFQQGAGIKNPSEAGNYELFIKTTADTTALELDGDDGANDGVDLPVRVSMDTNGDPRGSKMTVIALGVEGGTTATFWRDADGDGVRDSGERDLCSVVATSADVATCTYTIGNPPFIPGTGTDCDVTATDGDGLSDCNFVNVIDGDNPQRSTNFPTDDDDGSSTDKDLTQAVVDRQTFELEPTIDVQPRSANTGDTVTISVYDFDPADDLEDIFLAGIDVTPTSFPRGVPDSGQDSFPFTIPGVGPTGCVGAACIRLPTGVQRIEIFSTSADQDLNITIGGAKLTRIGKSVRSLTPKSEYEPARVNQSS